jgi:hypothetical protein
MLKLPLRCSKNKALLKKTLKQFIQIGQNHGFSRVLFMMNDDQSFHLSFDNKVYGNRIQFKQLLDNIVSDMSVNINVKYCDDTDENLNLNYIHWEYYV